MPEVLNSGYPVESHGEFLILFNDYASLEIN